MSTEKYFRGYFSIVEVVEKMQKLVDFYEAQKPGVTTLILKRKDYDLVKRWPKAASTLGFFIGKTGGVTYQRVKLKNGMPVYGRLFVITHDKGEERYQKKDAA